MPSLTTRPPKQYGASLPLDEFLARFTVGSTRSGQTHVLTPACIAKLTELRDKGKTN